MFDKNTIIPDFINDFPRDTDPLVLHIFPAEWQHEQKWKHVLRNLISHESIYADFRKRLNPLFRRIKLQFIRYDDKKEMK